MIRAGGRLAATPVGPAALAGLALVLGAAGACTPAGPKPSRTTPAARTAPALPAREPTVRVGVAPDTTRVTVSATSPFRIEAGGASIARSAADVPWTFSADADGRIRGTSDEGGAVGPVEGPVVVRAEEGANVRIGGHEYRGTALVRSAGDGRVTGVNVLDLEAYLLGVVPSEIPSLAIEAVKAQAVAARTYALGNWGSRSTQGFDFYATVADQVYGGVEREDPMAARAVRETRGEIVTYGGAPILAYYHSTCGGRTAAIEQVWNRPPQPYLRSVSDAKPGSGYYCDISHRFDWQEAWSADLLRTVVAPQLAAYFGVSTADVAPIEDVEVEARTTSGRVGTLRIRAGGRDWRVHGDSIRWILRPAADRILNSVLFDVQQERSAGRVTRLVVNGHGWGHGIGMCQMGAIGRAQAGQSYRQILQAYYSGTEVTRLY